MRFIEKKKVRVGKVKKTEDGEWMVPVYVDGKFNDDMTYYAGEGAEAKKDAEGTRDQIIKDMKNSKEYEFTEEVENREPNLLVIDEEIEIKQGDSVLILEKGDKIKIIESSLPPNMVRDYERRAKAERRGGGHVEIDTRFSTVSVTLSDGSEYFFQEGEADDLLDEVPDNIAPEDYILAVAQGW